MSKPYFSKILHTLKPDLIIYDVFPTWITEIASSHHIPAVHFMSAGALSSSFFYSTYKNCVLQGCVPPFPSSTVYLKVSEINKDKDAVQEIKFNIFTCFERSCDIVLIKTCREIEGKYLEYHRSLSHKKKIIPIGPLTPQAHNKEEEEEEEEEERDENVENMMQWLSKKDKSSTIYISLGSESFLSSKQMEELAYGLKLSNVNFIWVVRFEGGEKTRARETLPKGFLDKIKEKGFVLEGWAPQTKILGHSSIGGFISHCGWSSVMESLAFGIPIIGIPIKFDQPLNARLVVELGAGLEVMKDENLEIERNGVARVIKEVMIEESGEGIRRKARELGEKIRMKGEEEMDDVVEELRKLHNKLKLSCF